MSLEGTGFPVGKADLMTLHPMTFLKFLDAVDNRFISILKNLEFEHLSVFHDSIINLLYQYIIIGGMPAAVKSYAESRYFTDTREIQNTIQNSYYADFIKHIPSSYISKVRSVWDSVPVQQIF